MKTNEHGTFCDYKELELPVTIPKGWDHYKEGITISYGEHKEKWGYFISLQTNKSGFGGLLTESDIIYNTKNEMLRSMRIEVAELCNKYFNGKILFKNGHLDYLLDKIYDKYIICCNFEGTKEPSFTEVTTTNIDQVFIEAERIFKKPVISFKFYFYDKDKTKHFNSKIKIVNKVNKPKYTQGELF